MFTFCCHLLPSLPFVVDLDGKGRSDWREVTVVVTLPSSWPFPHSWPSRDKVRSVETPWSGTGVGWDRWEVPECLLVVWVTPFARLQCLGVSPLHPKLGSRLDRGSGTRKVPGFYPPTPVSSFLSSRLSSRSSTPPLPLPLEPLYVLKIGSPL